MAEKLGVPTCIRAVAKVFAWITAFVAPIRGAYAYVHSGNLQAGGLSTQLGIWQVLWNLSINLGYLMLGALIVFYIGLYVIVMPIMFVVALATPTPPPGEVANDGIPKVAKWVIGILCVLIAPAAIGVLLGAIGDSLTPAPHSIIDQFFGVAGGIYLFGTYLYVFLAATGNLDKLKTD